MMSKALSLAILVIGLRIARFASARDDNAACESVPDAPILPAATSTTSESSAADGAFQQSVEAWNGSLIDHVPYNALTPERFFEEYQSRRRPVVIRGIYAASPLTEGVDEERWGWRAMRDRFGDVPLENRVGVAADAEGSQTGCTGLGLCNGDPVPLRELFDDHFLQSDDDPAETAGESNEPERKPIPYPHDIELRKFLPEMFATYQVPHLFAENLMLPVEDGRVKWPSLFLGAEGTATNMHVDALGTSFTMAVFRGRKQFLLVDAVDAADGDKLCTMHPSEGLDYGLGPDPFDPDFERCPEARWARPYFADVRAGDVLFLPGHVHHAARNLEKSVGISQNFLSLHDFGALMEDFGGFAAKVHRRRKRRHPGEKTDVQFDFLAIRDLYHLLNQTDYHSEWRRPDEKPFWNADDAAAESYRRLVNHLSKALSDHPRKYATRLAFLSNPRLAKSALQAYGAWECIQERDRAFFEAVPWNSSERNASGGNIVELIEDALGRSRECARAGARGYVAGIQDGLRDALRTLRLEEGLTENCCV